MLNIAISPCPNDLFIFYYWLQHQKVHYVFRDIELLNCMALREEKGLIKVSVALYPLIASTYVMLPLGGAIAEQGPLVIATEEIDLTQATIAVPGMHTTATSLVRYYYPQAKLIMMESDQILNAVCTQKVEAGVLIHACRARCTEYGVVLLCDLGRRWIADFRLPIPLGVLVLHHSLVDCYREIIESLHRSLQHASWDDIACRRWIMTHTNEKREEVVKQHLDTYVNRQTYQLDDVGYQAITSFLKSVCSYENRSFCYLR